MEHSHELVDAFLEELPPSMLDRFRDRDLLLTSMSRKCLEARTQWSTFSLTDRDYARALGRSAVAIGGSLDCLDKVIAGDFYLAQACLAGDSEAHHVFAKTLWPDVMSSVARVCRTDLSVEEMSQQILEKILVGSGKAKLALYNGTGPLVGWLRIVAVREALMARRAIKGAPQHDDQSAIEKLAADVSDPHAAILFRRFSREITLAVEQSFRSLSPEDRNLIRLQLGGLSIDELAPLFSLHRATVARRLVRIRETVSADVAKFLRDHHGLSASEAQSLCRELADKLDVSFQRILESEDEP